MSSLAILVGVAHYANLTQLSCCPTDVEAVYSLVTATKRFDAVHMVVDVDASTLKDTIRSLLKPEIQYQQVFFYFSGHGHSDGEDFYFCLKDFHDRRPNETGLSNRDLHSLLREASPELVVKVVDACNSGSQLIKAGSDFLPQEKGGLKNVVQIASCLDSQTSLTGEPLSEFTDRFCRAATRKEAGPVYYNDIISILRDEYLSDTERYPHFVFQASARETLVDDASMLSEFRDQLCGAWAPKAVIPLALAEPDKVDTENKIKILSDLLARTESEVAQPQDVSAFVDKLFDGIRSKVSTDSFEEFYSLEITEHADFDEFETEDFITRVLVQEKRNDAFVTATVKREYKAQNSLSRLTQSLVFSANPDTEYTEKLLLKLNLRMDRAQMRLKFTPKFAALQQINLIVSCAPSLETCYLFELATRHPRTDWSNFSEEGVEVTRRWYKLSWRQNVDSLIDKISDQLAAVIKQHLEAVAERLMKK